MKSNQLTPEQQAQRDLKEMRTYRIIHLIGVLLGSALIITAFGTAFYPDGTPHGDFYSTKFLISGAILLGIFY